MTTRERMTRILNHQEADRCPIVDSPWATTVARWRREGMPDNESLADYFGIDTIGRIWADNSPRLPVEVLHETDEWVEQTTYWGARIRRWKHTEGVPQFLDFAITDPDSWRQVRSLMTPDRDRID